MAIVVEPKPFELGEITQVLRSIEDCTDRLDTLYTDLARGEKTHSYPSEIMVIIGLLSQNIDTFVQQAEEDLGKFKE